MHKRGLVVYKLCPCLRKGPTNSTCMRAIVTAVLQRQYLQMELIEWMQLVLSGCGYTKETGNSNTTATLQKFCQTELNMWNRNKQNQLGRQQCNS
jgi:hypothetical protein